jgi:hypothetical protein
MYSPSARSLPRCRAISNVTGASGSSYPVNRLLPAAEQANLPDHRSRGLQETRAMHIGRFSHTRTLETQRINRLQLTFLNYPAQTNLRPIIRTTYISLGRNP